MSDSNYTIQNVPGGLPVKMWTKGVPVEDEARKQLANAARLPIVFKHIAAMPDVHLGIGATVGSVIPTINAIIPAAVGVDIGCGMMAAKTTLRAEDLPDNLGPLRSAIEKAVPHGSAGRSRGRDPGSWVATPASVDQSWPTSSTPCANRIRASRKPTIASIWGRWVPAITSSKCVWTRPASYG